MKTFALFALLFAAMVLAGCAGPESANANHSGANLSTAPLTPGMDQFLNNSTAAVLPKPAPSIPAVNPIPDVIPVTPSSPVANGSAPSISNPSSANGTLGWDQKDALKITLLRKGETMEFPRWQIRLDNITFVNAPAAGYTLMDGDGKAISPFTLRQNQSYRFTASDGVDYLVVAVFKVGEGVPSAVQTQAYRVSDLSRSAFSAQIGAPMNAYNLRLEFPEPRLLANQTLQIGQSLMAGELGAELTSIDRSGPSPTVSLRLLDNAGSEVGRAVLKNGQMVDVRMPSNERYSVVLAAISNAGEQVTVAIYQTQSFRSQTSSATATLDANATNASG